MNEIWMSPAATRGAGVLPAPPRGQDSGVSFADEVESWLRSEASASAPVLWCPRGTAAATVSGADALSTKIANLADEGDWGVARRAHGRTWAQCMRVDGGWIVEVNGIPGPDCFARRVQATTARKRMLSGRRRVRDGGRLMAVYERADVIPSAEAAGAIMWSWLRGALPDGYSLQDIPN